ncbi:MAG TPA: hypothetical protein V6D08_04930 [Candidatus Obscuribacterales bacterium]
MAQRKPEEAVTCEQVLQLVEKLSPDERKRLIQQLTIAELGLEVQKGIDAADRGESLPAEQVFAELKQRNAARMKENS